MERNQINYRNEEILKQLRYNCHYYFCLANGNILIMQTFADNLHIKIDKFLYLTYQYIEEEITKPDYVKYIDKLLEKDKDERFQYLDDINAKSYVNYKYLKDNITSYLQLYRPHLYYLDDKTLNQLNEIFAGYEAYLYRRDNPSKAKKIIDDKYYESVIEKFINYNFSKKRFCFNNKLTVKQFDDMRDLVIKKKNPTLYTRCLEKEKSIEEEKNAIISQDVNNILAKIKEDPDNFALLDILLMTNYDILELIKEADNCLDLENKKLFRKYVRNYRNIHLNILTGERLNGLFKTTFIYNINDEMITITEEELINIINFLQERNIPICYEIISVVCQRFANEKAKKIRM